MSLNSVAGKAFLEKINGNYNQNKKSGESAYESFAGNLKEKAEKDTEEISQGQTADKVTTTQVDYRSGKLATEILLQRLGRIEASAVMETSVRHITYGESDDVKVSVSEGYTLKAQVDIDTHTVYVEQKNEDGTYQAYEVNPLKVSEDTENPIEQIALEAWEIAKESFNNGMLTELKTDDAQTAAENTSDTEEETDHDKSLAASFSELADKFAEYAKERIKEGPPKIQIGGAEYSEEEWERFLKRIDKDIDAYKEELRERIRKQKEEELLITETEALEETQEEKTRGSSFLARLSSEKKAPYSYLADETGTIVYKGVTFVCDDKKQQICLGDMSDSKNVLTIPLSKGGCLKVNRDNLDDLTKAIDMFSPADIARIMRAIAQDTKIQQMELEIDEMTS